MAQQIKFLLDGEDRGQVLNPEAFGVTITEDQQLNIRIVSFDNDLEFGGDVYSYLFDLFVQSTCDLVSVDVQYLCGRNWQKLTSGWFVLSECTFNLDRCRVTTKLYDENFSTKINNNKGIKFSTASILTKNLEAVVAPDIYSVEYFNPATGVFDAEVIGHVTVYDAFKHLVSCMSDNLIDFDSDYFRLNAAPSECAFLTNGRAIFNRDETETLVSFEQLYQGLNKKVRLGIGFEKQSNGRPLMRIEEAEYFFQSASDIEFIDQPNIKMSIDTTTLYASVGFGCDPYLEDFQCNGGSGNCTFVQTPFRGFRQESFGMLGTCNTQNELSLESLEVIFDTNVIEDIYRFNSQDYMNNPVIMYCTVDPSVGNDVYRAKQGDPYGIGQTIFNAEYTNEQTAANWLGGYPNSLFNYIAGFNPLDTDFNYRMDASPTQQFQIDDDALTYYSEWSGDFIVFGTAVNANSAFVNGRSYIAPYAGIYSFSINVCLDDFLLTGNRVLFAALRVFNSADEQIRLIIGTPSLVPNIDPAVVVLSASVVLNQGDQVRGDVAGQFDTAGPPANQIILNTVNIGGVDYFTSFAGIGEPFEPSELQPVDRESIRNVLYQFERPLSMNEITSMLNNSAKPIKLGRLNDPNRTVDTWIKSATVESLVRQNGIFTLKSNEILR